MTAISVAPHLPANFRPDPRHHHRLPPQHQGGSSGASDAASPPSVGGPSPSPSPSPRDCPASLLETPTKKNKRKLSEPRKRGSDFSIKRLCPDSPGGSAMSESGCSEEEGQEPPSKVRKVRRRLSHDDPQSRGTEREDAPQVPGSLPAPRAAHHAFFPSGLPPAACFMPGFYLTADGRAGFPPPHYPAPPYTGLPLGLPHPGFAPPVSGDHQRAESSHHLRADMAGAGPLGLKPQDLSRPDSPDNSDDGDSQNGDGSGGRKPRKNYKNMTRERRVEANARERTRVHTISAAFDALRRAVPSYSYNQKLSKLAILRIACTYIMALARLADIDCSSEPSVPVTFADCVDLCTRTIQTEGRARRRH